MKRTGIVIMLCVNSISGEHHTKQPQPSTAQIAVINFVNMMQSMINIAVDPDNKENVALQISSILNGAANIAIAGMRTQPLMRHLDDPEELKKHIIAELQSNGTADALAEYCRTHRDEMFELLHRLTHAHHAEIAQS